jgi:hypothetical protein
MAWLWVVAGSGWVLALVALLTARRSSRRLALLSEHYWELKYEHGELKARLRAIAPTPEEAEASRPVVQQTFVPLSSLTAPPVPRNDGGLGGAGGTKN